MKLDGTQETICKLLSLALFENEESFQTEVDWDLVLKEMKIQTVEGLVQHKLSSIPASGEVIKKWQDACYRIIRNNIVIRVQQTKLSTLFEEASFSYLVLKGAAAAVYYPDPVLRVMGDIDIYVSPNSFDKAKDLMVSNGYMQLTTERDHDRHMSFSKDQISFELHKSFATINGEREKEFVNDLLNTCCNRENIVIVEDEYGSFCVAPTKVNGIVLLEHIAQHMLSGLGLRQIVDWMMFVNSSLHDEEWPAFSELAENAGLVKLAKTVTKMCCSYFGLKGNFTWCQDADAELSDEVLRYLFESGNFGRKNKNVSRIASVNNKFNNSKNKFKTLQLNGERNWKLYKKHHWLRPFAWVYQTKRYVFKSLSDPHMISNYSNGLQEAKRRKRMLDDLGVYREF